jgi:hypothetical protein
MRVTIIAEENRVNVEGQSETVDLSTLDQAIHVVQWYGTVGEVEYIYDFVANTKKANERISSFADYQKFVDAWEVAAKLPVVVQVPNAA